MGEAKSPKVKWLIKFMNLYVQLERPHSQKHLIYEKQGEQTI